jgi:hypothetical protein
LGVPQPNRYNMASKNRVCFIRWFLVKICLRLLRGIVNIMKINTAGD